MKEGFRPVSNTRDESFIGQLKFYGRMLLDLQILTIFRDVKKEMQHKYKQINRYVEIVADILRDAALQKDLHIVDMGSGKGYLTFALADYEIQQNRNTKIVGVEMRQDLVDLCNQIAILF